MSLETKIEKLTEAVELLTRAILETDIKRLEQLPDAQPEAVKDEPKAEKPKKTKAAETKKQDDAPTVEELQSMCMKLVRSDKANKAKIVELVGAYDGAKTIAEVPKAKLPELKEKLEAL